MKKLFFLIILGCIYLFANGIQKTGKRYNTYNVKEVIICDSQFTDTLVSFLSNDSVLETLQKNFIQDLNFRQYFKGPNFLRIYINKRNNLVENNINLPFRVFTDLIDDSLETAMKQDSLLQVVIHLSPCVMDDYGTTYKGWNLYFEERYKMNNQPLFKVTRRRKNFTFSLDRICSGWISNLWIPLIYYNNKLYIEPDSLQWFILRE
ncbi:MAG: hypothetical protein K2L41_11210 [Muribaculaceae bacterium]|nr:hypothetical protein [Muribaculaceae bacterium]